MKVMVVGSGGREHVLTWKLAGSNRIDQIYIASGNPGTAKMGTNIDIPVSEHKSLLDFAIKEDIDHVFVGPEAPLVEGIVDLFNQEGVSIFGPVAAAARLEGSKVFAKKFMEKHNIPTASFRVFEDPDQARNYMEGKELPLVIKAEGLAAGKGVIIVKNRQEAEQALTQIMEERKFGPAGNRVVVEEFLPGEEATILAFCDGKTITPLIPSQDHKPAYNGGKGPNTGGMGAYAPAPVVDKELMSKIYDSIMLPTLRGLQQEGIEYRGVLYFGLMISRGQPRVLEYNVRFGDPEAQVVLPLLKNDLLTIAEAVNKQKLAEVDIEWQPGKCVCVVMASGGYPLDYETGFEISGLKEIKEEEDIVVFQAGTEEKQNKLYTAGGRVLGVTAVADTYQLAVDRAYGQVEKINFAGAHYRTDIACRVI